MQSLYQLADMHILCLAGLHRDSFARKMGHLFPFGIQNLGEERE